MTSGQHAPPSLLIYICMKCHTQNRGGRIHDMGDVQEESPFPLTDVDRWVLSQTDEEFQLQTWGMTKELVSMYSLIFVQNIDVSINLNAFGNGFCRIHLGQIEN